MTVKTLLHCAIVATLVCGLSACGNKGRLKSPSQIETSEAKKKEKQGKAKIPLPGVEVSTEAQPAKEAAPAATK